jgi:hypothetical protein
MTEKFALFAICFGMIAFFGTLLYEAFSDITWEDVFPKKIKDKKI